MLEIIQTVLTKKRASILIVGHDMMEIKFQTEVAENTFSDNNFF